MKNLKTLFVVSTLAALVSACATINEPSISPSHQTKQEQLKYGKFGDYIHLKPTQANSITPKKNAFFGLSALQNSRDITLSVRFTNVGHDSSSVLRISTLKLILDGEDFVFRNRNSHGDGRDYRLSNINFTDVTKSYSIPKEVFTKLVNSKSSFYEVATDTLSGPYIHKGYFKDNSKTSAAYKSFVKYNSLLTSE